MRARATERRRTGVSATWRVISERLIRPLPARLRDPHFWIIQALIAAVTAFHVVGEISGVSEHYGSLRHMPVTLYVVPVVYAALRYGFEGGLLTGLWCFALAVPNLTIWHSGEPEGELSLLALVLAIGLVLAWRVERETTLRREAEAATRDLRKSQERLQFYLHKITKAQEEERQRVARELHDDTLQSLVLVGRGLEAIVTASGKARGADLEEQVQEARTRLDAAIVGLRRLARDLRPSILDRLGLVPSIEWLLGELGDRQQVKTDLVLEGEIGRLPPEVELTVFRLVQEALRNVEVHAEAKTVSVELAAAPGWLEARITDDGSGFHPNEVIGRDDHSGLGLLGMQERAQLLGGTVDIESAPGAGTTVTATVALDSERGETTAGAQPIER